MPREYSFSEGGYDITDEDGNPVSNAMAGSPDTDGWSNPDSTNDSPTLFITPTTPGDLTLIDLQFYVKDASKVVVRVENPNDEEDFVREVCVTYYVKDVSLSYTFLS